MNRKSVKFFIGICIILFSSCSLRQITKTGKSHDFENKKQEEDRDYYYAFTEATKQALFNNYRDAINIYRRCIESRPDRAAAYFQISNIYMRTGEFEYAKAYAKRAIDIDKKNVWYFLHLASLYQMQRNIDSTIIIYRKIVKLNKDNIDYMFNLALLFNEASKYRKSLKTVNEVESVTGQNERIIYLKHDLYDKLGRKRKAINELKDGIIYYPENTNFYGLLAEYYAEIGETGLADSLYHEILIKNNNNSKVILSYADFLLKCGRNDEAFIFYSKAVNNNSINISDKVLIIVSLLNNSEVLNKNEDKIIELSERLKKEFPDNIKVRKLSADINLRVKRFAEASDDLKFIVKEDENNISVWERLLYAENMIEAYDSVIKYSDDVINRYTNEVIPYIYKGLAYMQTGEFQYATEILSRGLKITDKNEIKAQIYGYLAEVYRKLGDNEKSDKYFEISLKLNNDDLIVKNNYSYYLAVRGANLKRAEELSKNTIKNQPDNSTFLDTFAWIMYKSGEYKRALKYIEKAYKNDRGNNDEIKDHYGDILFKLRKYEDAVKIWKNIKNIKNIEDFNLEEKIKNAQLLENDIK